MIPESAEPVIPAHATCPHRRLSAWTPEGGDRPVLWSCADCRLRFLPACETCTQATGRRVGHD